LTWLALHLVSLTAVSGQKLSHRSRCVNIVGLVVERKLYKYFSNAKRFSHEYLWMPQPKLWEHGELVSYQNVTVCSIWQDRQTRIYCILAAV